MLFIFKKIKIMKTLILILTFSFLMNCYTYKTVATEKNIPVIEASKTYEILLHNKTSFITRNLKIADENYVFTSYSGKKEIIPILALKTVRERTFSSSKTILFTLGIAGTVYLIYTITGLMSIHMFSGL